MQLARCVRVSFCLFWDTGAVGALREGLILLVLRHWRRLRTALGSFVCALTERALCLFVIKAV